MSDDAGDTDSPEISPWYVLFIKALAPFPKTHDRIFSIRPPRLWKVAIWVSLIAIVDWALIVFINSESGKLDRQTINFLRLATPVAVIWLLGWLLLISASSYWIGKRLGGTGTFAGLFFACSVINISIGIATVPFTLVDFYYFPDTIAAFVISAILFPTYQYWLFTCATKSIHRFGWAKSVVSTMPLLILESIPFLIRAIFIRDW